MASTPENHSHPVCAECGQEFPSVEQLGRHFDNAHRQKDGKQDENPTNIGPGVTEEYESV